MAVKFSDFTQKQDASVDVTNMVGYLATGELNIMIPPANLDTTYAVSTGNAGASPTISIQGTKPGQAAAIAPSTVSLTGSGATLLAGNGTTTIDFASTTYALAAGVNADPAVNTPVTLTGLAGGDAHTDTVNLIGTGTVQITSTGGVITIDGGSTADVTSFTNSNGGTFVAYGTVNTAATGAVTIGDVDLTASGTASATTFLRGDNQWATPPSGSGTVTSVGTTTTGIAALTLSGTVTTSGDLDLAKTGGTGGQYIDGAAGAWTTLPAGDTYTLQAGAKAGTSVPLQLDAAAGADSTVSLTEGTGITLTQTSATEITIASAAGISRLVTTDTGDGTTLIFTDITGSLTLPASNPEFNIDIYISGVYQAKASYTYTTATNGTITFASGGAPPNGAAIEYVTTT
tara:strand:- start:1323 stop:2528 length:1206 start_codon:yes stop_codon:yes gene_type:complete